MTISVGDKIPDVTLRQKRAEGIDALSTDDVFKGKKCGDLIALPKYAHA